MKSNPSSSARLPSRFLPGSSLLLLSLCASLAGCLSETGTGSSGPLMDDPLPSDDYLTGTSSSTSWPPEPVCQDNYFIMQLSDSALSLAFLATNKSDGEPIPVAINGTATIYLGGGIPVLQRIPSLTWEFRDEDTLQIPLDSLAAIDGYNGSDTVAFSIRLDSEREADKEQAILIGYLYSISERRLLRTTKSLFPNNAYYLKNPAYSLRGIGRDLANGLPAVKGKSKFYFYIPGTDYFWERNLADTIWLGPLPDNDGFPLRLLRKTEGEGPQGETLLELFDISFESEWRPTSENSPLTDLFLVSKVNRMLWSGMKPSPLIRDSIPMTYSEVVQCKGQ